MNFFWIPSFAYDDLPYGVVYVGYDRNRASIYVGRVTHEGDSIPAIIVPCKKVAYFSYLGQVHNTRVYDFLCIPNLGFSWIACGKGYVPDNAVSSGCEMYGTPLFVGRTRSNGTLSIGKVHPVYKFLFYPFGEKELRAEEYEVLVIT